MCVHLDVIEIVGDRTKVALDLHHGICATGDTDEKLRAAFESMIAAHIYVSLKHDIVPFSRPKTYEDDVYRFINGRKEEMRTTQLSITEPLVSETYFIDMDWRKVW